MNTRRMTLALGAAAGGMLASAFLSTAVAIADPAAGDTLIDVTDTNEPNPLVETVNGIPPLFQDASGYQLFTVDDTTVQGTSATPVPVGTEYDYWSQYTFAGGDTNTEYTTGSFVPDSTYAFTFTDLPGDGSVFDTFNFGNGLDNVYSDVLAGTGTTATSTVTDLLQFDGTTILNLTSLVDAFGLSPADFTLGL
jgi:hypothetical protein